MSGQQIGTVVGFVAGFWLPGGPQVWAAVGGTIGGALDPAEFQGPSIGDAQNQTSQAGAPIPKVYGHPGPFAGTLIDGDPIARKITRETEQGKGSGPTVETEGFIATRAFLICEGEVDLLRVRRNGKLVWSAISGDALEGDSAQFASQLRFYRGSETQGPDPSLEAIHGVGNTPYYGGRAYAVIVDDDETQGGGAANQYTWEVAAGATLTDDCIPWYGSAKYYWPLDDAAGGGTAVEVIQGKNGVYSSADVSAGPALRAGSAASCYMESIDAFMFANYADIFRIDGNHGWTISVCCRPTDIVGGSVMKSVAACWASEDFGETNWSLGLRGTDNMQPGCEYSNGPTSIGAYAPYVIGEGATAIIVMTWEPVTADTGDLKCYINGSLVETNPGVTDPAATGNFVTVGGGHAYPSSYGFVGYISDLAIFDFAFTAEHAANTAWIIGDYFPLPDAEGGFVDRDGTIVGLCRKTVVEDSAVWKDIAADIVSRTPCPVSKLNIDNMTDEVPGFLLGRVDLSGADYLRSLAGPYFTDLPEFDGQIHAVRRGGAVVATITDDDLLEVEEEDDDERNQQIEAPPRVTVFYADPANNYVTTPQIAARYSPDVQGTSSFQIQTTIPFDGATAAKVADITQKIFYSRVEGGFKRALTGEYSRLVPSDPVRFRGRRHIVEKVQNEDLMVRIEASYDRASDYQSVAFGTSANAPQGQTSNTKGPTLFAALNAPQLRTQDNSPGMYVLVCGILPAWPGCELYLSIDGGVSENPVLTMTRPAIIGRLTDDVPNTSDTISVEVNGGELSSATPEQLLVRENAFALVNADATVDIGQFETATQTSARHYDLTDYTLGQQTTTETSHATGDAFVMLTQGLYFLPLDITLAGRTLIFRPVTRGTIPANNDTYSVVFIPQFTSGQTFDFYTDAIGEKYSDANGAFYYKET